MDRLINMQFHAVESMTWYCKNISVQMLGDGSAFLKQH